jgi:hypothetical protein
MVEKKLDTLKLVRNINKTSDLIKVPAPLFSEA